MCSRRSALVQDGYAEFERLRVRDVRLVPGGRHFWFVFSVAGHPCRVPCSSSPSDRHAGKSLCRMIRRVVFKARQDAKQARAAAQVAGKGRNAATGHQMRSRELVEA